MGNSPNCTAAILLVLLCCGGCSMCQPCELETYSAYGGRWQRTDRDHGRVGSLFAPAGAQRPYEAPIAMDAADDSLPPSEPEDEESTDEDLPSDRVEDDSVMETERQREERARRLRDLQLEDIRYQRPPEGE